MNSPLRQFISLLYLPWVFVKENVFRHQGVRILMFHSVASAHVEGIDNKNVADIPPRLFRRRLLYLLPRYRFISLIELVEMIQKQIKLPRRTLVITFDDGYANNFTEALPLLKEFHLRATIFVPSSFINKTNYLTTEMLTQLQVEHIEIGSHTLSHPTLSQVSLESASQEIKQGKIELETFTGKPVMTFAYPKGKLTDYSPEVVALVKNAGFLAACTTLRGTNTLKTPLFELRRIGLDGRDGFFNFWLKIHGGYDWTGSLAVFLSRIKRQRPLLQPDATQKLF